MPHSAATPTAPDFLEVHGVPFAFGTGSFLFLLGYFGLHWIQRRRFYRAKLAEPFPTYFRFWLTSLVEGWFSLFALFSMIAGLLLGLAGVVDLIDG